MAVSLVPSAAAPAIVAFSQGASYRSNQDVRATEFLGYTFSSAQRASNPLQLAVPAVFPRKKVEKRGLQSLRCLSTCYNHTTPKQFSEENLEGKFCRRTIVTNFLSSLVLFPNVSPQIARAEPSVVFREYVDNFDGYTFYYPGNWIQVRGAGADVFFRDPFILDENLSLEISSPSSSNYTSVEDLGPPEEAGKKVLRQLLTEFMSTRLGVRRESHILSTSSRVADDGKIYYQVEANIKSYANNNELAVMPQERITRLEWDRHYLSVLGVENSRLYELRLQTPVKVFLEEENDLRRVMDSFRVFKATI